MPRVPQGKKIDHAPRLTAGPGLADVLRQRAAQQPLATAYEFVTAAGVQALSYAELRDRALTVATMLHQVQAARPGTGGGDSQPVLILCHPGPDYVAALWGCIVANLAAVPAYPPVSERALGRLDRLIADADAMCVLADADSVGSIEASWSGMTERPVLTIGRSGALYTGDASETAFGTASEDNVAIIQYTSGSTRAPRGVALSEGNIISNISAIAELFELTEKSRAFVWLPPYHDMGLIGGVLTPAYIGFPVRMMSPLDFLKDPSSWLFQISESGATVSGGPNFSYDLVTRKFREDGRELDLSNWQVAFNGAEPVRLKTMDGFSRRFARYGFRSEAFLPCYGLAEATLLVSGGRVRPGGAHEDRVSCGAVVPGHHVAIFDAETGEVVADGQEGEVWLRGPSVSAGYWLGAGREPSKEATADLGGLSYVRTGDVGCLIEGELYISGRTSDRIIRRGRNYFAQDLEEAATVGDVRLRGIAAAFAVDQAEADSKIVLIAEQRADAPLDGVAADIRARVAEETGLALDTIVVVPARTIPRTSSGKTQRALCKDRYLVGAYDRWLPGSGSAAAVDQVPSADNENGLADLAAVLIGIFEAVCGAHCGENVSLMAIGGDSLTAAEIAVVVEEFTGFAVPVEVVLASPTPRLMAAWLVGELRRWGLDPAPMLERAAATDRGRR